MFLFCAWGKNQIKNSPGTWAKIEHKKTGARPVI
jgi:hypothetical protein